jgi:1,4-dihydroxy-2-naphthoate octaprenyltransferase
LHLLGVAAGWAYNLGLKATWASAVPYAVAFAVLPAVAVPGSPLWVSAVAGLLGVAAHFANTVGDTEADAATGVHGLPQRLGPEASLRLGAALVLASGVVLLLGSAAGTTAVARAVGASSAAAGAGVALVVAAVGRRLGRRAFSVMLLAVALVVTGTLVAGRAG